MDFSLKGGHMQEPDEAPRQNGAAEAFEPELDLTTDLWSCARASAPAQESEEEQDGA